MTEATQAAQQVYKELGVVAFMIFAAVFGLGFLIWRITIAQDRITVLLDKIFDHMDSNNALIKSHDEQCKTIAGDVKYIRDKVIEIDGKVG